MTGAAPGPAARPTAAWVAGGRTATTPEGEKP